MNIQITYNINNKRLLSVLESGLRKINQRWANVDVMVRHTKLGPDTTPEEVSQAMKAKDGNRNGRRGRNRTAPGDVSNGYRKIKGTIWRVVENDDDMPEVAHTLAEPDIRRGIALLAENNPIAFGLLCAGEGDSNTGDLLVQLCIFGEQRYML